jgi:hypothetical protein
MLKMKSVIGPTLDNYGQFEVPFGEIGAIETETFDRLITGTATGGAAAIPMTNTSGFAIGQVLEIQDSANREVVTISAITPGVSLTTLANLVNTYTVARGGKVSVLKYGAPRVAVSIDNPFTATTEFAVQSKGQNLVRVYGTLPGGALTQGEVATGTGLATGRVVGQGANYLDIFPLTGTFLLTDTITGGTSGRTLTPITSINPAGPATVLVTVEKVATAGAGPNNWAAAATAEVAGMNFTVVVDAVQ